VSSLPLVSVNEAAEFLGVTPERVRDFCREGRIGQRVGERYVISRDELRVFAKIPRKVGRPPRPNSE
jgi:excisionase family DNA binding protein